MDFRIGFGYDAHRLTEGRALILCGAEIPHDRGLLGHSDADAALHALMDAMLGAAALGDIGKHFPDTDEKYRGASSVELLKRVNALLDENGFAVNNADVCIVAQSPKLAPYMSEMKNTVAQALNTSPDAINIKATTTEKMGFEGRGEGISAYAVCSIVSNKEKK